MMMMMMMMMMMSDSEIVCKNGCAQPKNTENKSCAVAGMTARCRCEFRYLSKFTAKKMWEVPGYAHAPFSPKFLRGLISRGPS